MNPEQEEPTILLKTFKKPLEPERQPECLHNLFETQVRDTPDAVAVVFEGHHLTYAELDARANQLARHLRTLGVQRGTLVGIFAERSLEMVIALYATLKAGAAYVPIDPAYPAERVIFMLLDAQVPVLLTQAHLHPRVPPFHGHLVTLETDWTVIEKLPRTLLAGHETPDDLAYMIYTSGSTGRPKGAMNTHRGICNRLLWMQTAYGLQSDDCVLQKTPFSFDVSVWELFWPLLTGARLVMARPDGHRDIAYLRDLIQREGITTLHFVPSMLKSFLHEPAVEKCGTVLHRVISSGEALMGTLQARFFERLPTVELHNLYGPTEAAIDVTAWACHPNDVAANVPIGHPIINIQVHILRADQQLLPIGMPGELHIGGVGLARGYHRRPALTAEKFIPDSLSTSAGDRLYKTGDLARYRPDGTLDYLGRMDHQVKIRGFRIELGEIEAALAQHPAIRESVLLAWDNKSGTKRLVAYLVVAAMDRPSTTDLLAWLKRTLPDYMLPSQFVFLEALPLTPNGKVDRKALPPPDTQRPQLEAHYVAPTTPQELALAEIWSQALEVTPVGIHDNFFELGGDSIRAIQVLAHAQQQGMAFTLEQLFTHQTIHNLVQQLNQNRPPVPRTEPPKPFALISQEDHNRLPAGLEDAYPLTQLQIGMFYHNEKNPFSAIFHDIFTFRIQYPFHHEDLQLAVNRFIERHAPMRTSFDLGSFTEPLQLVHPSARLLIAVEDLQHLDSTAQADALDAWITDEKRHPFAPIQAPLLRMLVHRYSTDEFQLIVSFHHVILDGWSLAAMLTEILQDYSALLGGTTSLITPPAVPYRTYVALERAALAAEDSRQFWIEKLHDPDIQLMPRWPESYRAGGLEQVRSSEIPIPSEVFEGLKALALQAKAPLKSVLLAAHHRVMKALHGRPDVISGILTNGRPEEIDGERMIGLFLNTVPVRLRLDGGTWVELVQQTFQTERDLIPHRRFPLADIQQALGGQTLFETAFDFVHFHVYRNLDGYKDMGFMEGHYFEANNFVLFTTFMLDSTATQLQMHIDYDPAELCAEQIEAICGYYVATLTSMASQPHARYDEFSPLSAKERRQQIVDWTNTTRDYPRHTCVSKLFEAQVERTPEAIAVVFEEQQLTYRQLNARANQLAHLLRGQGVGPDVRVGLCLERGLELIISLLGILKAGGAYVPLDPSYPAERLHHIVTDATPQCIVSQHGLIQWLVDTGTPRIDIDGAEAFLAQCPVHNPVASHMGLNLAYLIYTSGSTGHPKGVMVTQEAVVNLLLTLQEHLTVDPTAVVLAVTSVAFDISMFELLGPLIVGGRLVLTSREVAMDGAALIAALHSQGITVMQATPTTWHMLLQAGQTEPTGSLKIISGGEPLTRHLARRLEPWGSTIWNAYGPTETTIWSTIWEINHPDDQIPIGRPLANTTAFLVDDGGALVPIGVAGEILIGGDGVARGYSHQPALTAKQFIPDPYSTKPGTRLYRTGDLARFWPDGNLECMGRCDHQVKVRGYRIELGEIESILFHHPAVQNAVVLCREDTHAEKQLVAYVVSQAKDSLSTTHLRSFLQRKLPEYMIPRAFVVLDALPLTPNGKLDRRALSALMLISQDRTTPFVGPQTPVEDELAQIWAEVLSVDQVGIYDNFFELGGHSLLATQLIARLRNVLELDLSIRTLFDHPTIAGFAVEIETQLSNTFPDWPKEGLG